MNLMVVSTTEIHTILWSVLIVSSAKILVSFSSSLGAEMSDPHSLTTSMMPINQINTAIRL